MDASQYLVLCLPYFDASASRPAASGAARVRRNSEPYFKDPQQPMAARRLALWERGQKAQGGVAAA
ncbi:MAG: hypothetical protein ACREV3_09275 [Gammaproteobacteria bacterium]